MEEIIKKLEKNELFKNVDKTKMLKILGNLKYSIVSYKKGEVIFQEEEICSAIGLIIDGTINIERIYPNGKSIVMSKFKDGDVFGEALLFSKVNKYPATVIALSDCKVLYLTKNEIIKLFSVENKLMENFMMLLSEKIIILNNKIRSISLKSVRQKVVDYILCEYMNEKNEEIKLKYSKEEIANDIGIPRPSLSRELIKLRDEGLINFSRNKITILNIEELEDILFN
ncbi:Crp/Fnr family transcriptional regulator [Clostridium neonatale]|uniref:Crp/Fnr family transcriptional regulator n=1 Tax=Clostridium neonatale TaxID=137838 RepID=UPI001B38D398|nr:Crp/Fnr family transcriptional regulator [Clostridium neonatale]MBP8315164.1 Crp/Fnr family transcriptional regulator [Clostridium neonatale]